MNSPLLEHSALQFELVMALSGSLQADEVLRATATTLQARVGARAIMIYALSPPPAASWSVALALPEGAAEQPDARRELAELAPLVHAGESRHRHLVLGPGDERHLFVLPHVGVLSLRPGDAELSPSLVDALLPITRRLGFAACARQGYGAQQQLESRNLPDSLEDASARERRFSEREREQLLLGAVGDAIIGAGPDGLISHWNKGAADMLGYKASDVIGKPLTLIMPEHFRDLHTRGMERHRAIGQSRVVGRPVELVAQHADGHDIPVELVLSHFEERGATFYVGVLRDVTERRRVDAETARRIHEERRFAAALLRAGRLSFVDLVSFKRQMTEIIAEALGVERVGVWRSVDDAINCRDLFERSPARHSSGITLQGKDFPAYFQAMREEQSIVAEDARTHPATECFTDSYLVPLGIVSKLDAPLRSLGGLLGVLCVEALERRAWTPAEVRFCEEVAAVLVQAIEKADYLRSQARHEVVLASIGDAVIACDTASRVTVINPVAEHITGWSAAEAMGRPISEIFRIVSAETREPAEIPVDAVLATGQIHGLANHSVLIRRDGTEVPIADSAAPIKEGANIIGVVLTFRDVTEEERARRAIEEQNRRLRSLSKAIPDLLLSVTVDGRVRYAQQQVDGPDLPVKLLETLFPPQLHGEVHRALVTGELQTVEYPLEMEGERHWFEARMARMSEEEATVLVRNVTAERKRTDALREERERLELVLSTTSAIIYAARLPEFSIEYVSDSVRTVLGYHADEFSRPGFWENALHPEDKLRVLSDLDNLVATGRHIHEYRQKHRDGSYRWLRDEVQLIRDADGTPQRAVGACFDITTRKLGESRISSLFTIQQIVSRLSAAFLSSGVGIPDGALKEALGDLARHTGADRAYVLRLDGDLLDKTHEWSAEDAWPHREALWVPSERYRYFLDHMRDGRYLFVPSVRDLPPAAAAEREALARQGVRQVLAVPLMVDGNLRGFIGIDNARLELLRPTEFAASLQPLADAVAAGLQRMDDEGVLRLLNNRLTRQTERQRSLLLLSDDLARAESRADLLRFVQASLSAVLGVNSIMLTELMGATGRYRMHALDEVLPSTLITGSPAESALDVSIHEGNIAGTSLEEALRLGAPVSTLDHDIDDFADWTQLRERHGYDHFVVIPLPGSSSSFASLSVGFEREEQCSLEEVDRVAQFASLVAAHLSIHEARDALRALNAELESRVESRTHELRASEERFEQLFKRAPQAMMIVDPSKRVAHSNLNAQALFGYEASDFRGLPIEELVPEVARGESGGLLSAFGKMEDAPPVALGDVVQVKRRGGETFAAEIGLVPLHVDGQPHVLAGVTDVSARHAAQQALTTSLREKETLLKEIHHRVKNNLQIISSLLMLQADQMPTPRSKELLQESVVRIRSMALIHEQLYGVESLERIDLGDYTKILVESLRGTFAPQARVKVAAEPIEVNVEIAVPLGLILNELITNAFKYGLPQRGNGAAPTPRRTGSECDVLVEVGVVGEDVRIAVTDSGNGLPDGFDPNRSATLGLQLLRSLNRQLRGTLKVDSDQGSRFVVVCPHPGLQPRP